MIPMNLFYCIRGQQRNVAPGLPKPGIERRVCDVNNVTTLQTPSCGNQCQRIKCFMVQGVKPPTKLGPRRMSAKPKGKLTPREWTSSTQDDRSTGSGGAVERWSGGAVERWSGGAVERWSGGAVERWSGGVGERGSGGRVGMKVKIKPSDEAGSGHESLALCLNPLAED